jgi:secondary thiamine-phosphate synthase enzyme
MVHTGRVHLSTQGNTEMRDLSTEVRRVITDSGVHAGIATLFTPSSTSALTTIEFEPGALDDLRRALDEIAPPGRDYRHNLRWDDGNGHAHLRAALLGPSLSVPIVDGQLALGTWQQVLFIDFDVRPRQREIVVQVVGEARE